jgi:putative endonuclease
MANWNNEVLYIGVTNNLERRVKEHKDQKMKGFTEKYNCNKLVFYEETDEISVALAREKQLKNWHRKWKNVLVNEENSKWEDLAMEWYNE